ncbi:MAG: Uma2 family endonuclease [Pirellulaceae bacterium]|nr:Uma2 family endonuclease [Pirellulaceae bacterium]
MSSTSSAKPPHPEPTWAVAHLFPAQGQWSENDFYALQGNRLIELVDGTLEVLPMPTWLHQLMVKFLVRAIEVATAGVGEALAAPLPIRLFEKNIREPDVMYFAPGSEPKDPRGYPTRVDLAMEVVSEGAEAAKRDYEDKRRDYARAGIPEYWIVDPEQQRITVLVLEEATYRLHGEFTAGQAASGVLLPALEVEVSQVMQLGTSS